MILNFPNRTIKSLATPQSGDNQVIVPPTLQPTVTLPGLLNYNQNTGGFSPGTAPLMQDSHIVSFNNTQPASTAAVDFGITRLAAGLWDVRIVGMAVANFLQTSDLTIVILKDPKGVSSVALMSLFSATNVPIMNRWSGILNLPSDAWEIQFQFSNTGVGQSVIGSASVLANRLA